MKNNFYNRRIIMKRKIFILMVFFVFTAHTACFGSGLLSGTFEREEDGNAYDIREEFTFSSNLFTVTFENKMYYLSKREIMRDGESYIEFCANPGSYKVVPCVETFEISVERMKTMKEGNNPSKGNYVISEGKENGTYSITKDNIEFVANNKISVLQFSRTENTITIGGKRYTRKK
jgi:hypothetical protein